MLKAISKNAQSVLASVLNVDSTVVRVRAEAVLLEIPATTAGHAAKQAAALAAALGWAPGVVKTPTFGGKTFRIADRRGRRAVEITRYRGEDRMHLEFINV